jgi:hypothetical protein
MQSPVRFSALGRMTTPIVGKAVFALLATAVMVAAAGSGARESGLHGAATGTPVFSVKAVVVKPRHAAAQLLPAVDHDDILMEDRILADKVLRALPAYCRDNLKNFYVNYDKYPGNRGLGGEDTIIVIKTTKAEFMALITHECGHVTDLGGLRGTEESDTSNFYDGNTPIYQNDPSIAFYKISWITAEINQPKSKEVDFVSGYAAMDPFEDFAETFAFYALQKSSFQKLAARNPVLKAKYDFMDKVIFAGTPSVAQGKYIPGKKVPWDVTKLPYVWHAKK